MQALDTASSQLCGSGFVRYMPSLFYPVSVVLFQLHECMVSHMQVLATNSSTVHSVCYWDFYSFFEFTKKYGFLKLLLRSVDTTKCSETSFKRKAVKMVLVIKLGAKS